MTRRKSAPEVRARAMSAQETADFLRRGNVTFLECAIALCVESFSIDETIELLECEVQLLREHG